MISIFKTHTPKTLLIGHSSPTTKPPNYAIKDVHLSVTLKEILKTPPIRAFSQRLCDKNVAFHLWQPDNFTTLGCLQTLGCLFQQTPSDLGVKRSFLLKSSHVSERPCRCCFRSGLSAVCFAAVLLMRSCMSSPPPGREHLPSSFPEEIPRFCGLHNPSDPSWSSCWTFNGKHLLTAERLQV